MSRFTRWGAVGGALLALACGCGDGGGASHDGPAPADLAPPVIAGTVGGVALSLEGGSAAGELTCGPRGLRVVLSAQGAASCDGGSEDLEIHLSDRLPGVYLFTGPVTCLAAPSGRGLFATLRVAGTDHVADGGVVVLAGWDGVRAAGSVDLSFVTSPQGAPTGRLAGNFIATACP